MAITQIVSDDNNDEHDKTSTTRTTSWNNNITMTTMKNKRF